MSSRSDGGCFGRAVCDGLGVGDQGPVDDVGESPFEGAHGLLPGVLGVFPALEVGPGVGVPVGLGQGDAVDGAVQLAVPDPAEAVAGMV